MRITTLFIGIQACFTTMLIAASSKAQNISLNVKQANIKEVFVSIEKQAGVTFVYNNQTLQGLGNITLKEVNRPLPTILQIISAKLPLVFKQSGGVIGVLRASAKIARKEAEPVKTAAQETPALTIKGRIQDESSQPLQGATVRIKDGPQIAISDEKGLFQLHDVTQSAVLIVSYLGYQVKEVKVALTSDLLIITLQKSSSRLDEVIIIPYGTNNERLNTGSVSTITSADIEKQPVSNPLAALEGRIPGLVITQNTGLPGANYTVQIRGRNSINSGTDPLYLIDGVPFNGNSLDQINGGFGITGQNPFSSINPADIENIEVLKDADATAIYGSRGANGVILITTKKGKAGKTKVTASVYTGVGRIARSMDFLNTKQYVQMRREALTNDGTPVNSANAPDLFLWDTTRYTDWKKLLIGGTAKSTDAQLTLSGGNEETQFLVGGNYHHETTVFPGNLADNKANVHFNLTHNSKDRKFQAALTASYNNDNNNLIGTDLTAYINTPPNTPPPYTPDGKLNWSENGLAFTNPLAFKLQSYNANTDNLVSNATFKYNIVKGLDIKTNLGYTNTELKQTSLNPAAAQDPRYGPNSTAVFGNISSKTWIVEPQAEYRAVLGKGILSTLVGASWQQDVMDGIAINAANFTSDALIADPGAAASLTSTHNYSKYRYDAIFGRINYNLDDKYLVNLTARRDGSSRFGPGKQFADFGAIGLGWIFSEENWIKKSLDFLSYGKLRASYGITGNDKIGDYKYLNTYTTSSSPYQGMVGLIPNSLNNPDYAWEINKKLEGAIELGFLNNRILFNAAYFRNRSSNQLINYNLPSQTGFSSILQNFPALIQNSGYEFELNGSIVKNKNFKWSSAFNLTIARNKLVSFPGLATSSYATQYVVGYPLDIQKVFVYKGVDPTTGVYQFNGTSYPDDLTQIVDHTPKFYGGFQNTFTYKGFELDIFFQFTKQLGLNYLSAYSGFTAPGSMYNQPVQVLGRWQKPGDITTIQKFTNEGSGTDASTAYYNYVYFSSGKYSDASFIRLKTASLSYSFAPDWLKKIKAEHVKVYVRGQNLLTITKYLGNDPETGSISDTYLPPLRVIIIGFQFTY